MNKFVTNLSGVAKALPGVFQTIKNSDDHKATVFGTGAAGAVLMSVDPAKLFAGDHVETAKVVAAGFLFLLGWATNKGQKAQNVANVESAENAKPGPEEKKG